MPQNAEVHIYHGKYKIVGINANREYCLEGLREQLIKNGHTVHLHELQDIDEVVEVTVNGEIVCRCKIFDFHFGGDGELDEMCHKVVNAVRAAY